MFTTVEQFGWQEEDVNDALAPEGRPDDANDTAWLVPEFNVAEMVAEPVAPAMTETAAGAVSVKLKLALALSPFENQALASALAVRPALKAFALTRVLVDSTKALL